MSQNTLHFNTSVSQKNKNKLKTQDFYYIIRSLIPIYNSKSTLIILTKNCENTCDFFLTTFFFKKTLNILNINHVDSSYYIHPSIKINIPFIKISKLKVVQNAIDIFYGVEKNTNTVLSSTSSSLNKYLPISGHTIIDFQFLRKNKVFNKGRYSRCRQNYRTGVYLCMYLSVVSIFGLYFWFYKFSFNFTYLWWFFICFFGSFFLPKIIKYRLYEPNVLMAKFTSLYNWALHLIKSIF